MSRPQPSLSATLLLGAMIGFLWLGANKKRG